jgi:hypothetical protein
LQGVRLEEGLLDCVGWEVKNKVSGWQELLFNMRLHDIIPSYGTIGCGSTEYLVCGIQYASWAPRRALGEVPSIAHPHNQHYGVFCHPSKKDACKRPTTKEAIPAF